MEKEIAIGFDAIKEMTIRDVQELSRQDQLNKQEEKNDINR